MLDGDECPTSRACCLHFYDSKSWSFPPKSRKVEAERDLLLNVFEMATSTFVIGVGRYNLPP